MIDQPDYMCRGGYLYPRVRLVHVTKSDNIRFLTTVMPISIIDMRGKYIESVARYFGNA